MLLSMLLVTEGAIMAYLIFIKEFLFAGMMAGFAIATMWYNRKNLRWITSESNEDEIMKKLAWLFIQADKIPEISLRKEVKRVISEVVYSACKGVNTLERWYDAIYKLGGKDE